MGSSLAWHHPSGATGSLVPERFPILKGICDAATGILSEPSSVHSFGFHSISPLTLRWW